MWSQDNPTASYLGGEGGINEATKSAAGANAKLLGTTAEAEAAGGGGAGDASRFRNSARGDRAESVCLRGKAPAPLAPVPSSVRVEVVRTACSVGKSRSASTLQDASLGAWGGRHRCRRVASAPEPEHSGVPPAEAVRVTEEHGVIDKVELTSESVALQPSALGDEVGVCLRANAFWPPKALPKYVAGLS